MNKHLNRRFPIARNLGSQMIRLQNTLNESLKLAEDQSSEMSSAELLEAFLAVKRLEGRSDKTLALYRYNIGMILNISEQNACTMTTDDIRKCLAQYQEEHEVNKATLDNAAAIFPAFSDGWRMKTISSSLIESNPEASGRILIGMGSCPFTHASGVGPHVPSDVGKRFVFPAEGSVDGFPFSGSVTGTPVAAKKRLLNDI